MKNETHPNMDNTMTNGQKLGLIIGSHIVAFILNIPVVAFVFWSINSIFGTSIVIGLKTIVPTIILVWTVRLPKNIPTVRKVWNG